MLFNLHPKEHRDELFGRDSEVEYIKRQVRAGNWVIIGGQRGIGKTSLLKVVLNELSRDGLKTIYINVRSRYWATYLQVTQRFPSYLCKSH